MIEFISHEFVDDEYVKEIVYLQLENKYRVAYVRRSSKTGGMFWSTPSISITKDKKRIYLPTFICDSKFLENDVKKFLESRSWEGLKESLPKYQEELDAIPF